MMITSRRRLLTLLASSGLALVGCSSEPSDQAGTTVGFSNPVVDSNVPDPMIIVDDDGTWWAFATNGNGANVQTMRSTDLISWEQADDALPQLPAWTESGATWAPEVARSTDGHWLLYYTTPAPSELGDIQSVSVAVADSLGGPYVDSSTEPLVCETKIGGSIDPHPFTAPNGDHYLYWKNDGNRIGVDTWISVQRMDASGTSLLGEPTKLIKQDLSWEGSLIEAPFVFWVDGTFWLFYSANAFDSAAYAVGVARAQSPTGPFVKLPDPVLASNDVASGPGHCAVFRVKDKPWMVYHAWPPDAVGSDFPGRTMWLSEVTITADEVGVVPPAVNYPTRPTS